MKYGVAVLSDALIGVVLVAAVKGPSSPSTSPLAAAGPTTSAIPIAAVQHVQFGIFRLEGKHGNLGVVIKSPSFGSRSWSIDGQAFFPTGQYKGVSEPVSGGERVQAGGRKSEWYARLHGVAASKRGLGMKQRVLIELSGRPEGTFKLIPTEPGFLERDFGTQSSIQRG